MVLKQNILKAISFNNTIPLSISYWILVFLRYFITLLPQNGYIHPDEFFQNIEVIAGDIFMIEISKPWEFNPKFPIRNLFVPRLLIGLPFHFINNVNPYTKHYLDFDLKTPYFLLVIPRLFICTLSFVNDYCLYKICILYGQNVRSRLKIFASSYVVLVYYCRTLSNTFETMLFSVLLFLVADCMAFSDKIIYHSEFINTKYDQAVTAVEKVKLFKLKNRLPAHSLKHVIPIATIVAIGIFNRPTFMAFSLLPVFFWLQRGLGSKVISFKDFHARMLTLIACSVPSVLLLILFDSFYYGYLTMADIEFLKLSWNNWVVTPLNFLRYNSDTNNLKQHGLHPRWLHLIINVPMLFSVLGLIMFAKLAYYLYRFICGRYSKLPRIQSITGLMTFSVVVPLAMLSLFPHQEARFIIPILLPIVYLYGNHLHSNESDSCRVRKIKNTALYIWYVFNVVMTIFFGFVHQGGVYLFTRDMYKEIKNNYGVDTHIFTSHMYSVPTFLLQLESTKKVYTAKSGKKYTISRSTFINELGSLPMDELIEKVNVTLADVEKRFRSRKKKYKIIVAVPCSKAKDLNRSISDKYFFKVIEEFSYYPHFSSEALPDFESDQFCKLGKNLLNVCENTSMLGRIKYYFKSFCLKTYIVQYPRYSF